MLKICTKCKLEKEHFNSKIVWCKECRSKYSKEHSLKRSINLNDIRYCIRCKKESLFSSKGQYQCKECVCEMTKEYQNNNKIIISEKMKIKRKEDPNYSRKHVYKKKYNITIEDYDKLLISQNYKCAICKSSSSGRGNNLFDVDHCHTTGKIRGLLCIKCNMGLGSFKDNKTSLEEAINYLTKNKT